MSTDLEEELQEQLEELREELAEARAAWQGEKDYCLKRTRELITERNTAQVVLGRAVAALRDLLDALSEDIDSDDVAKARVAGHAVITDPTSAQAGEAWRVVREKADERLRELALRLVAPGPKACVVSASECHEITDAVVAIGDALAHGAQVVGHDALRQVCPKCHNRGSHEGGGCPTCSGTGHVT